MAGQVIPRGERIWLVRVFLGRDPSTNKRHYHNHTIHGSKKDAQRYLNGVLREKDLGTFIEPSSMTLNEYLNHWLETAAKPKLRERTYIEYKALLQRYVRPNLGGKKLSDIHPVNIQALYTELQKKLSARTIRYTHAVISSAFKQAVKWRMMAINPASLVELPKQVKKEMKALSPEDAKRFLQVSSQERLGFLFAFVLNTGLRPSEYLGLQWKDIDLEKGVLMVQRSLVWRSKGQGWYFTEPKTLRSRRNIPLPSLLARSLVEYKRKQAEERLKMGPKYQNNDLVFATSEGTPFMPRNVIRYFKEALKRAGLPITMRLYDLRHSCATLLLAANENPKVVAERLGHASITLTLDTYSHVLPSMQKAASEKLEQILLSKTGTL